MVRHGSAKGSMSLESALVVVAATGLFLAGVETFIKNATQSSERYFSEDSSRAAVAKEE